MVTTARIILLGATGYTGRLILQSLLERGERPLLAGRSEQRLRDLAHENRAVGALETAVVDAEHDGAIRALLRRGDVLISTVGPFAQHGWPAAQAAADAGAHYLDTTGEVGFVHDVRERLDATARDAGATMVPAFGYDYVPGMLAGALAAEASGGRARTLRIGYFMTGPGRAGLSGGTRATMADGLGHDVPIWRDRAMVMVPGASTVRTFRTGEQARSAVLFTGTEVLFLPREDPQLRTVEVYLGWFGRLSRALATASRLAHAVGTRRRGRRFLDALAKRMRPASSGGPDAPARARTGSLVLADALDAAGESAARVTANGPNTYTLTGHLVAEGAIALRDGAGQAAGVVSPVEAFGLPGLRALADRAGMTASITEPSSRPRGTARTTGRG